MPPQRSPCPEAEVGVRAGPRSVGCSWALGAPARADSAGGPPFRTAALQEWSLAPSLSIPWNLRDMQRTSQEWAGCSADTCGTDCDGVSAAVPAPHLDGQHPEDRPGHLANLKRGLVCARHPILHECKATVVGSGWRGLGGRGPVLRYSRHLELLGTLPQPHSAGPL